MPSNQRQIIEQAKFTYSPLGKAFEKQTKTIEDQGKKQVDALTALKTSNKKLPSIKDLISIENLNPEIVNEIKKIEEEEKKVDRNEMVMILENLKRYVLLVTKLKIMLLVMIWQIMKKTSY